MPLMHVIGILDVWYRAEPLEFGGGGGPFNETFGQSFPASRNNSIASSFAPLESQFPTEEIGLADLPFLSVSIRIFGCDDYGLGRHLAEVHSNNGRWPFRHVNLRDHLRQAAGQIASLVYYIEPQRSISVARIKLRSL